MLKHYKGTPEHNSWVAMKQRCYYKGYRRYDRYGGRGIKVCDSWLESFENFYNDMGPKPSPKHSLDRIDTNGNYCPENCRWATKKEQARNRRNTKLITHNGRTASIPEWSEITGIPQQLIHTRIRRGWSDEDAISISNCRATL